jgi:hypothetical protein
MHSYIEFRLPNGSYWTGFVLCGMPGAEPSSLPYYLENEYFTVRNRNGRKVVHTVFHAERLTNCPAWRGVRSADHADSRFDDIRNLNLSAGSG